MTGSFNLNCILKRTHDYDFKQGDSGQEIKANGIAGG